MKAKLLNLRTSQKFALVAGAILLVLVVAIGFTINANGLFFMPDASVTQNSVNVSPEDALSQPDTETSINNVATNILPASETENSLNYIIEEEKLAYDVYAAMYSKWGSKVFSNIQKSETNHQNKVLALLKSKNIADPRSTQPGVFNNQDLQALYDKLIAQGNQSPTEAFKVGVAIEELDIADLKTDISKLDETESDVKIVYESLLSGSQKHLAAFNRQLSR
ncbi:MAG: hypothetical protein QG645_58 [Patescibacteria group bacterium]|nr:hypothetical protein [Patescibacteria group bacterium]